jgi:hypothetical protein
MPDLRWDQFLQHANKLTTLVDLDAFVYGPREVELVLLEYLFNDHQAKLFEKVYGQFQPIPALKQVRKSYRLLLFLMNVLGEGDLNKWMKTSGRWK